MISSQRNVKKNMQYSARNQELIFWFVVAFQVLLLLHDGAHAFSVGTNGQPSYCPKATKHSASSSSLNNNNNNNNKEHTVRYRCRVAYDGGGLSGFQVQKAVSRTVQGDLEAVLSRRFDRPVRVVGAGRTDAGVHARGQAIHFDLSVEESQTLEQLNGSSALERAMNSLLMPDVRVWNVNKAPPPCTEFVNGKMTIHSWNVMRKCHSKLYVYRFSTNEAMEPSLRHNRWQLDSFGNDPDLDTEFLAKILNCYQGTRDFVCFAGAIEQTRKKTGRIMSTIRTVYNVTLVDEDDGNYRVEIFLKGALYKMVRNMVGTAIAVCQGHVSEQDFQAWVNPQQEMTRDDNRCKPAPPQGLTLERVFYNDDDF
jgi:tRNA pseudouridine38-40 synthase